MRRTVFYSLLFLFFSFSIFISSVQAAEGIVDSDNDGISDQLETQVYQTDQNKADTDGDGFNDKQEIINGYDPLKKGEAKLKEIDFDKDGLSDQMELIFNTDPTNPDSDNDGYKDGAEVKASYNPASSTPIKLVKRIEVNLAKQELSYFLGAVRVGKFIVSSGVHNSTPKGTYTIANKIPNAWSNSAKLWMPFWMGLKGTKMGLHELPYWPDGRVEGEKSLGHPASHGCVRMGRHGEAETLYKWAEVGIKVIIN